MELHMTEQSEPLHPQDGEQQTRKFGVTHGTKLSLHEASEVLKVCLFVCLPTSKFKYMNPNR